MAAPSGFVQSLVDYANAIGSAKPLEEERDALYERIAGGEGGALITSTINGKSFGWSPNAMTVEEKFSAFSQAIKEFNGERVTTTHARFPWIDR